MRAHSIKRLAAYATLMLGIGVAFACGAVPSEETKTDPANGTGPTKNWSFTASLSKENQSIVQGATDTVMVTITRSGGFTGAVTLEAFVPPGPGLVVTFEPITTTGVTTTTRMLIAVGASYPVGSGFGFGLAFHPASNEVQGASKDVTFTVLRKPGTFVQIAPTISIGRGQSGSLRVAIIRTAYDLPVPMSLVTTVAGITATFSPNPILDTISQATISVDASVPEGTYNVGIRANETLPAQGTAPLLLTVTAPGSFTVSVPLPLLLIPRGTTVPMSVNFARTNFTGAISVFVTGVPAGATATIAPPTTTNSLSVSFSAGTAPAGDYPLTINATAVGMPSATTTMTLRIGN